MGSKILEELKHFINGKFENSENKDRFSFLNPSNNEVIGNIPVGCKEDVDKAVIAANRSFKNLWSKMPISKRSDLIYDISRLIMKYSHELSYIEAINTGIPITQVRAQIERAAENFKFFAEIADKVLGEAYVFDDKFINYAIRQPIGVAALITPWNTPLMLETWKIAPCIATGNTCILKPAEWTPLSANKLALIIHEAGIPEGVLNIVHGIGEVSGAELVAHPGVKLVSFTGETVTGMEIMRNGASTLKRYSMELGGKNPAIVFSDADLKRALDAVVFMAYSLNGERCTSNSRVLIEEKIYDDFIEMIHERIKRIKIGDPLDETTELGPLVRPEHWDRVKKYINIGIEEGAKLVYGGERPEGFKSGNYLMPTLFKDCSKEMKIAREEIFGPVLIAMKFRSENEAIDISNDTIYGLTAYIWTKDIERANRIAKELECGMIWINSHNVRDLRTPFGGAKYSGIGREGGRFSFDFYTEWKTIQVALGTHKIPTFGLNR
jgi:5-carboxymethyl-2-hydroxymuconate semialdehyde dehydrogenase (EC 1.2.1.60)